MASISNDFRLFGLDLRAMWLEFTHPWKNAETWPLFGWFSCGVTIRLLSVEGGESVWFGGNPPQPTKAIKSSKFVAVELPDAQYLHRTLQLPNLAPDAIAEAVALEVYNGSPFSPNDLVWGYGCQASFQQGCRVEVVWASRKQVEPFLQSQKSRWNGVNTPEVWALVGEGKPLPVVIKGFGENLRGRYRAHLSYIGLTLVLSALAIGLAIALTPTAQLRMRGLEAVASYTALQKRVEPVVHEREAFMKSTDRLAILVEILNRSVDPLQVLDFLTKALPDDTSLQSIQVQGLKVSINGLTSDVTALMKQLSSQAGVRDVKAPTGTARQAGSQKENFIIEFELESKVLKAQTTGRAEVSQEVAASSALPMLGNPSPSPTASAPLAAAGTAETTLVPPKPQPQALSTASSTSAFLIKPSAAPTVAPQAAPAPSPFSIGGGKPASASKTSP